MTEFFFCHGISKYSAQNLFHTNMYLSPDSVLENNVCRQNDISKILNFTVWK